MSAIGAELVEVQPGFCRIHLPYSEKVTQQHGFFHGGVISALADNAAGFAGYSLMGADEQPLSVEFKINFLATAKGDALEAQGKVIRAGRRLKHVNVEIFSLDNGTRNLVAIALATITSSRTVQELPE
jgi:uncharacterized protein (TIGR00369 family)